METANGPYGPGESPPEGTEKDDDGDPIHG